MRKTAFRLVIHHSVQSSSFSRIASMSQVDTGVVIEHDAAADARARRVNQIQQNFGCRLMLSLTFRIAFAERKRCQCVGDLRFAPSSGGAATIRPWRAGSIAMAAPIPRDAPVTNATCPEDLGCHAINAFTTDVEAGSMKAPSLSASILLTNRSALYRVHDIPPRSSIRAFERLHAFHPAHGTESPGDGGHRGCVCTSVSTATSALFTSAICGAVMWTWFQFQLSSSAGFIR
jgi:hypothetical protein